MDIVPVTLTGKSIRLEPLSESHVPDLEFACADPPDGRRTIWRYLLDAKLYREAGMSGLVKELLRRQSTGSDLPFAIIDLKTGRAVGTTRYADIRRDDMTLEILTWISIQSQRVGINLQSKYLILRHAFNTLGMRRVQFKIDHRNFASIDAIERIRATREGLLRNHILLPDGTPRSSLVFSILDSEWPAVELHIENLLAR